MSATPLEIVRGDKERLKVFTTASAAATGLRFMVKKKLRQPDSAALIDKSIGAGIVVISSGDEDTLAEAQIVIDPEDTKSLRNKRLELIYELEDGDDHRLDDGVFIVKPKVILDELELP